MLPHTRAIIAAATHALATGKTITGVFDHARQMDLQIAAEARGGRLQAFDGDRDARFGGTLPDLYDQSDKAFVSLDLDGMRATGYDRKSSSHFSVTVTEHQVQLYDYGAAEWFTFDIRVI
ncbi:MAG: hypothetical protein ACK4GD_01620 [Sphingomonadaceae bacterium]